MAPRRIAAVWLGILLLALTGVCTAWLWKIRRELPTTAAGADAVFPERQSATTPSRAGRPAPSDPRATFASLYRNIRPEVKYLGDDACSGCHRSIARTFRQHPMGRSFAPLASAAAVERYDPAGRNPFEAQGLRYLAQRDGDRVVHKEMAIDAQGRILASMSAEVHFAVGSGQRGRSYLIDRDGYLFQSPLTWYPQKHFWDLSPGYTPSNNPHFGRPIVAGCLFCHANRFEPVEHTANRYQPPLFRGHAIGCERCHGPGQLHVERRRSQQEVPGVDDTIVNPRRLEHALREAVCQQCHLQGEQRVLGRGRSFLDYRPGLPLSLIFIDFVKPAAAAAADKFVGTVEQMYASRCFRASSGAGKLGCISCHDPHSLPAPEEKAAFFRNRCLSCHREQGCSLALTLRQKTKNDDCVACHMPRTGSEINHTAITDHRIPRQRFLSPSPSPGPDQQQKEKEKEKEKEKDRSGRYAWPRADQTPLVAFPPGLLDAQDEAVTRGLGLALVEQADQSPDRVAQQLAQRAYPLLEAALQLEPEDAVVWEAKGNALWFLGRLEEAWVAYEAALARAPERETTLHKAATLAQRTSRLDKAFSYCDRAIQVNPWRWQYYYLLAGLHSQQQDWGSTAQACQRALQLNPVHLGTRLLLLTSYLRLGDRDKARAEFETFVALHPAEKRPALRRWFAQQGGT